MKRAMLSSVPRTAGRDGGALPAVPPIVLARCRLLSDCSAATLRSLAVVSRSERVLDGVRLCRMGETVREVMFVLQGRIELCRHGSTGKRHVAALLGPGQVVGLVAAIDGAGALHDAWAREDSTVLRVPAESFLVAMRADPELNRAVMGVLCHRSRLLYDSVSDTALSTLRTRTVRALQRLSGAPGLAREQAGRVRIRMSQDELADLLGVTRQSVNRELKRLEREGLIVLGRACFELVEPAALGRTVDLCG
jgi:CRP/FNR family cyclic AMP-dependent transcriptional regulator